MTDNIGFLISDVSRLMRRQFDERARVIGVTRAQWRTLTMLNRNEGINQGKLAELLEVEPITLCRMVDRLEEAGHVERRRDPHDRRAWQIYLTDSARPLIDDLRAIADTMFAEALAGIDPQRQSQFIATLNDIRANLAETDDTQEAHHG
ncbi:MAG: transcriptional regulator [Sphingomonas sp. 28-63-12]|nr:MAG: transcriptional regulator [Sphingomonas sp. 28-63-12]